MAQDWLELTKLTGAAPIVVERVKLAGKEIRIEGEFELPPLARLSTEDQVFVMAFVRGDGSIKELERTFGISYPTVKNRLARITGQFEFVQSTPASAARKTSASTGVNERDQASSAKDATIEQLRRGEITAAEAIGRLSK